jgi:hypothetical protein
MKKAIPFLLLLNLSITSFGQITKTKVAESKKTVEIKPYDSTKNFLENDVYSYIGQELYVYGKHEDLRKYGYEGFFKDYTKSTLINKSNVYKCCDNFNSKYTELVDKYFKVLEVIKHPEAKSNELLYGTVFYLKLEEKESKDIVYFEYDSRFSSKFHFVVVGYFSKQKKEMIGKKIVVRGKNWMDKNKHMTDMATGNPVSEFEPGKVWAVVDLTIEEKYYTLSLILENSKKERIPLDIKSLEQTWWAFKLDQAKMYKVKFGEDNWQRILEGKVKIGMTDEMCKLSWGSPKKINETITSGKVTEQWVYEDNNLYFSNKILTTIK